MCIRDSNATGNSRDNSLLGNAANNTLSGGDGSDSLFGAEGSDKLIGGAGNDVLIGDADAESGMATRIDRLVVYARGSACEGGWPVMEVWLGGLKIQSFQVDSAQTLAYTVTAPLGIDCHSVDIVFTNDAYRPDLGQDRNLFVDRIEANGRTVSVLEAGAVMDFGAGAAAFDGFNSALTGGVLTTNGALRIGLHGNDWLEGGAGTDTMAGGFGNDVYVVDNSGDLILEAVNAGHDSVRSSVDYALGANLEDLVLVGSAAVNATGNSGQNTLRGNAAANRLDGGAGADMLVGGAGGDTYLFGRGYGADIISDYDLAADSIDVAAFGEGIGTDQLWFRRLGGTLEVSIVGTNDRLSIGGWYSGRQFQLERFETSNGRTLLDSQVQNLVNAMAGFAPPPLGQTSLPPAYANQLGAVIAANWQ